MPDRGVQYSGQPVLQSKLVFFIGTTTLRPGQALCLNDPAAGAGTAVQGFGVDVVVPTSGTLKYFAGVVAESDAGKVGPCWVDIVIPQRGDTLYVEVDGTTDVAVGDNLSLQSTSGLEGFAKQASPAYSHHPLLTAAEARTANSLGLQKVFVDQA